MTEQELRGLVRDAIARHVTSGGVGTVRLQADTTAVPLKADGTAPMLRAHASHAMFAVPAGADSGGSCVIEPAVACNHCGYCKSYGH